MSEYFETLWHKVYSYGSAGLEEDTVCQVLDIIDLQIPRKPVDPFWGSTEGGAFDYLQGRCPSCEAEIAYGDNYCPECGQHISWEVTVDDVHLQDSTKGRSTGL